MEEDLVIGVGLDQMNSKQGPNQNSKAAGREYRLRINEPSRITISAVELNLLN
jgi:hypothetical protein